MDKKTFVCETVKAVLTELTKLEPAKLSPNNPSANLQQLIDNITKFLCDAYDKHLINK